VLATFQATFRKPEITADDRAAGIIRGVYVMELGKLAQFSARRDDGTKTHRAVTLDDAHLAALMNHAGNRSIPVHMTHSHTSKEQDGLVTKAGALKGFFRDDSKNLRADLHLAPGATRETALWHAENDPENFMLSAVYSFLPDDPLCIPQDFQAADLVEKGAGVTALLAADLTTSPMDETTTPNVDDLLSKLSAACQADPHTLAAVKAMLKSIEKADKPEDETEVTEVAETPNDDAGAVAAMAALEKKFDARLTAQLADFTKAQEKSKADLLVEAKAQIIAELGSVKVPAEKSKAETALFGMAKVKAAITAQLEKQKN